MGRFYMKAARVERGVIAMVWHEIDQFLLSGSQVLENSVWLLMSTLPAVEQLPDEELPRLSQLHLSSAANLMATIKLLAPSAFPDGASSPDESRLLKLDSSTLSLVSCLIDLQLFHLERAAQLAATSRRRKKHMDTSNQASCVSSCCNALETSICSSGNGSSHDSHQNAEHTSSIGVMEQWL